MTDIANFKDPILSLVRDPNLNKDETKSSQIVNLIHEISERRLNKLCSTTYIILQTLDKIQLKFKSWEFLSLDYNSNTHFANVDDKIKIFNTGVADKVMQACSELNYKIVKIAADIDLVSKSSRTLSVSDLISDEGTMLTSLLLRVIKLKDEIVEQLSISYSKAKLILIGRDLELMHYDDRSSDSDSDSDSEDDGDDDTVSYYKTFIVTLLKQLNDAILANDFDSKYECLAVINDLEKMFEKYKMEKMIDRRIKEHDKELEQQLQHQSHQHQQQRHHQNHQQHTPQQYHPTESTPKSNLQFGFDEDSSSTSGKDSHGLEDTFSEYSMTSSTAFQGHLPMVRSITQLKSARGGAGATGATGATGASQRDSRSFYDYELSSSNGMYKSSITEELPYLRTAFDSAKNFENDVSHYKQEVGMDDEDDGSEKENLGTRSRRTRRKKRRQRKQRQGQVEEEEEEDGEGEGEEPGLHSNKQPFFHKINNLPQSTLYTESKILQPQSQKTTTSMPSTFLNTSGLLRTLGIRPQVINVPHENTLVKGYNRKQVEEAKEKHDRSRQHQQQQQQQQLQQSEQEQEQEQEQKQEQGHDQEQQKYLPLSEENVLHLSHEYLD
ncbi:unnamed protein product [Candida parapsilosis]